MIRYCTLALLLWTSVPTAAQEVDALLLRMSHAYGGLERIVAATVWRQNGITYSQLHGATGRIERAFRYPDHLRVEISYDGEAPELRQLAGQAAWRQGRPVTGALYSSMLMQAARLGLPATLIEYRELVRDAGVITSRQGRELRVLELNFHGSSRLLAGIDPVSGRILESSGSMVQNGQMMEFTTGYDDFRFQDGRLFAYREVHYGMGRETGYTQLEQVEILDELPDDLFQPGEYRDSRPATMAGLFPARATGTVVSARSPCGTCLYASSGNAAAFQPAIVWERSVPPSFALIKPDRTPGTAATDGAARQRRKR